MSTQSPKRPTVAVGVPVFNGEDYIAACLESIIAQDPGPDEILIADNASTDQTMAIVECFAERDPRIVIHRNETNLGAAANYNLLPHRTDADYFAWIAHDDLWSPGLLAAQVAKLEDPTVAVAFGGRRFIDANGNHDGEPEPAVWSDSHSGAERVTELLLDSEQSLLYECLPVFGLMRRELLLETGIIRPFGGSDKVLIVEMALKGRLSEVEPAFLRRRHEKSSVRVNPGNRERLRWFDPTASRAPRPTTRVVGAFCGAVRHSDLSLREKAQLIGAIGKWSTHNRRLAIMRGELKEAAIGRIGRLSQRLRRA